MKKLLLLIIFLSCWTLLPAQLSYGTTGLLHAPSADMQKDKTVMLGGNFLHQELTPPKFNFNLNSATHIVRNKFKILSNNILPSILPCQKIHLT